MAAWERNIPHNKFGKLHRAAEFSTVRRDRNALLSFGKKKVSKENLLTAHFARGVVFLDSRIIKRLFARKRQRVFFWLLFFSKRKVTPCLPGIMKYAHKRMKPPTYLVQWCRFSPAKVPPRRRTPAADLGQGDSARFTRARSFYNKPDCPTPL